MPAQDHAKSGQGFVLVHHSSSPAFAPHRLMNPVTYLGRQPGNDIVLPSANVSRRHAKLIVTDLGVTAHDLDSHNGIFLNGKKVRSAPVAPGDRLYIGDVCLELQRSNAALDVGTQSSAVHDDVSDEDDPRARSLAALMRVAALCAGPDDGWAMETIQICRELVEAVVAAFVEVHDDGELDTPVILQPEARRQGAPPVLWTAVQRAIEERRPVFSADIVADGLATSVGTSDARAVMAVPVLLTDDRVAAVVYLSRAQATNSFTEVELETLGVIARVVGMRIQRERGMTEGEDTKVGSTDGAAIARIASLEDRIAELEGGLKAAQGRSKALETQNQSLLEQAELLQKTSAGRDAEAASRVEYAVAEAKKAAQRDVGVLQRDLAAAQKELAASQEATAAARREADEARTQRVGAAQQELMAVRRELEDLRSQRAGAIAEVEALNAALVAARGEQERLAAELKERDGALTLTLRRAEAAEQAADVAQKQVAAAVAARAALEQRVTTLEQENAAASTAGRAEEVLRQAMRTSVLPTVVDHVEAMISGDAPTTAAVARPVTVAYLALAEFDAWCERAPTEAVRRHLDTFCATVSARAQANGGRLDQVIGHGHLLVFPADPGGARAAVRCALEVAAVVESEAIDLGVAGAPHVVAGIHTGTGVAGFFGDTEAVSYIEAGPPVVIARAAVDFAPKGSDGGARGVLVSDPVRSAIAGDAGFSVTRLDPSWIRGVNAPVQLALVDLDQGGAR